MEKPCNCENVEKHPKKKKLRKRSAFLLKNSFLDSLQFLLVLINVLVSP